MPLHNRILIVDDQDDIRTLIRMILATKNYTLDEAHDGSSAMKRIKLQPPDLILLDIMMPGAPSGLDILRSIKEGPLINAKVVMISAKGQAKDVLEARIMGCDGYIVKPFTQQQLLDIVGTLLADQGS